MQNSLRYTCGICSIVINKTYTRKPTFIQNKIYELLGRAISLSVTGIYFIDFSWYTERPPTLHFMFGLLFILMILYNCKHLCIQNKKSQKTRRSQRSDDHQSGGERGEWFINLIETDRPYCFYSHQYSILYIKLMLWHLHTSSRGCDLPCFCNTLDVSCLSTIKGLIHALDHIARSLLSKLWAALLPGRFRFASIILSQ